MTRRVLAVGALVLAFALVAAACADDDSTNTDTTSDSTEPDTTATTNDPGDTGPTTTDAAAENPYADFESSFYAEDHRWMCRPDLTDDICDEDYSVTSIAVDGERTVEPFEAAEEPPIDCFYVYPTVAGDRAGNADIDDAENRSEEGAVRNQAARFGEACNVYAPLYRQATLGAISGGFEADRELAYNDAVDSFRHYLGQWNDGRPFVLMGHSQGSGILNRIIQDEIDDVPALREQLVSALLIGSTVTLDDGSGTGPADFVNIPPCEADDQTGCVISYASFRATAPPPANGFFGRTTDEGPALCSNPGALAGGSADLTPIFESSMDTQASSGEPPVETPYVSYPGLVTAECLAGDDVTYLEITINAEEGGRIDDFRGDLTPEWGLHVIDLNLGIDALVDVVAAQAATHP